MLTDVVVRSLPARSLPRLSDQKISALMTRTDERRRTEKEISRLPSSLPNLDVCLVHQFSFWADQLRPSEGGPNYPLSAFHGSSLVRSSLLPSARLLNGYVAVRMDCVTHDSPTKAVSQTNNAHQCFRILGRQISTIKICQKYSINLTDTITLNRCYCTVLITDWWQGPVSSSKYK